MSARGQEIIKLPDDREVVVLFTNRALADAEAQMGKSVIGVAQGFTAGQSTLTDLTHLLRTGMTAARRDAGDRRPVTMAEAYAVMDEVGFTAVAQAVMPALAAVLGYDGENGADPNG